MTAFDHRGLVGFRRPARLGHRFRRGRSTRGNRRPLLNRGGVRLASQNQRPDQTASHRVLLRPQLASAAITRAQERAPRWKEANSYFSLGE